MRLGNDLKWIETKEEVATYLSRLDYALKDQATRINVIKDRQVDKTRDSKYSNAYALATLFENEDYTSALKRELFRLRVEDYIESVRDKRFPNKSAMRVFGKKIKTEDVYIKVRVELSSTVHAYGEHYIMVMSFHFSEIYFKGEDFPYGERGESS